MDFEREQQLVAEIKKYVTENLPLNRMEDAELEEKIEEIELHCDLPRGIGKFVFTELQRIIC